MMKDFRYEKGGTEIEAFQMNDRTRYAEKEWPTWMDSRWLMTVDGEQWLDYQGNEMAIPPLGWICNNSDGTVSIRGALEMEEWTKVVQDSPAVVHPESGAEITDEALAAAHGIELPDKVVAVASSVPQPPPIPLPVAANDDGLFIEVTTVYEQLKAGNTDVAIEILRTSLSRRVTWCNCVPGRCDNADPMGCRQKSPLL